MGRMEIATYIVQYLNTQLRIFAVQMRDESPAFFIGQNIRQGLDGFGLAHCANYILPELLAIFSHGPTVMGCAVDGMCQADTMGGGRIGNVDHTVASL